MTCIMRSEPFFQAKLVLNNLSILIILEKILHDLTFETRLINPNSIHRESQTQKYLNIIYLGTRRNLISFGNI